MCFDTDSLPPIPVLSGGALTHEDLVLESGDGARFAAFAALPDEPSGAGVVILPDVRGLYRFYEELALRFAERGYAAVAIDYFGRTAGVEKRGDDFEYRPHVEQTTPEGVQADTAAAVARLRERGPDVVFTVGFCFGGRNSWLPRRAATGSRGGRLLRPPGRPRRLPRPAPPPGSKRRSSPSRRADQNITAEDNAAFDAALDRGRSRARARDVRRRAAQLLRPQAGGVRRSLGRRLATLLEFIEPTEPDSFGNADGPWIRRSGKSSGGLRPGRSALPVRSEGPGRQSGPRFSFLSRAGYGLGSRPPGEGPTMGGREGSWGGRLPPKLHLNLLFRVPPALHDQVDRVAGLVVPR